MRTIPARALAMILLWAGPLVLATEEPPVPAQAAGSSLQQNLAAGKTGAESSPGLSASEEGARQTSSAGSSEHKVSSTSDAKALRAETLERLQALKPADGKAETGAEKALREVLQERIRLLDAWDQEQHLEIKAESQDKNPERQGSEIKHELERVRGALEQAAKDTSSLLPEAFRGRAARVSTAAMTELKEAVEAARADLNQATSRMENERANSAQQNSGTLATLRAERDRLHVICAALPARQAEHEAAVAAAKTSDERDLAKEKLVNFEREAALESQRLRDKEHEILLQTKLAALEEPRLQVREAERELAKRTLQALQDRYSQLLKRQQQELDQAVAHEKARAEVTNDPLERFRAKHAAELLALKALALSDEHTYAVNPVLSLDAQRELADRAERDFAGLKQVVDEGRSSGIVALRLRNDYRRLEVERAAVARTDLARSADEVTRCDNALTAVEFDLLTDARDERYVLDELLATLPPARRAEAVKLAEDFEAKHRALLLQRRTALERLCERAQAIHSQVMRRLTLLDDQYAFVRTHIFWTRDAEPIGAATLFALPRDASRLATALVRTASEIADRATWGRVSVAFALLVVLALALPLPLRRARRILFGWLEPGPHLLPRPAE